MITTRTRISTAPAVALTDVKALARITHSDEDALIAQMTHVAASELEAHSNLALLSQIVTVTLNEWGNTISLPIGPLWSDGLATNPVTVQARDDAGVLTTVTGWWIEAGRYPVLHLTADVEAAALIVAYPAGYGADAVSIPQDLRYAIMDQVASTYDMRGMVDGAQGLSLAASRIAHRNRKVRL